MANEEQLAMLRQGVEVWNKWLNENRDPIDLSDADLSFATLDNANLIGADLFRANLFRANLAEADLTQAKLMRTDLMEAKLWGTNLHKTELNRADLRGTNLTNADLTMANLGGANLTGANLTETDLTESDLREANLTGVHIKGTIFLKAVVGSTIFGRADLGKSSGLDSIVHKGPSNISTDTFVLSKGEIPEIFLKGCGLSDLETEEVKLYKPNMSNNEINTILYRMYDLRASQALQISPLFISYSHADTKFVDKLENQLNSKGIRFWRDIHDMKAGKIEKQIDQAISQNRTLLLVISEHALKSDWIEHEVRTARGLEIEMGRDVLCPVALDDSWKSSRWPQRLMEQIMEYNILDFSEWKDDGNFDSTFRRLIDGLELFYKG